MTRSAQTLNSPCTRRADTDLKTGSRRHRAEPANLKENHHEKKHSVRPAAFSLSLILAPAALTTALAAPTTVRITASDSSGDLSYPTLYTESSWMSLEVPVSVLGGTIPSDLSLDAGTLTAGTTITLDSVSQQGDVALLRVTVSRANTSIAIDETATINVMSGGQTLATLSIPVIGAASSD